MVMRSARTRLIVAVATFLAMYSAPLMAGDYHDGPRLRPHSDRPHRHHDGGGIVGGAGLPSVVPGLGTFAGSISAVRVRGNGIYFAIEGSPRTQVDYRAPKAKIIEITAEADDAACAYEVGVCVIRPK